LAPEAKKGRTTRRRTIFSIHRWLGLAAAVLWLFQAVTGALIVFHWEEDDASISAPRVPTDLYGIGRTIDRLAPAGSGQKVTRVWTSAGFRDRYDLMVQDDKSGMVTVVRVAGDGSPIRITPPGHAHLIDTLVLLHQSLLAGTTGRWIIGASGTLLFTNLIVGMVLAWPKKGNWRRALRPPKKGGLMARYYGWHRALGLIWFLPALLLVSAGILLAYNDPLQAALGATPPMMMARPGSATIAFGDAVTMALRQVPSAKLSAVELPSAVDATYKVHVRMPGEWRRAYGDSFVFVDGVTGRIRGIALAKDERAKLYWFNTLAPTHTGEAFGIFGRIVVLCTGFWLATMILLGARLWWLRRRREATKV